MKDTITEEDMLIDITKTEIEKRLTKTERENEILKERLKINEGKMGEMQVLVNEIYEEMKAKERQVVYNTKANLNTKASIFYQETQPIALNKLKENIGMTQGHAL